MTSEVAIAFMLFVLQVYCVTQFIAIRNQLDRMEKGRK